MNNITDIKFNALDRKKYIDVTGLPVTNGMFCFIEPATAFGIVQYAKFKINETKPFSNNIHNTCFKYGLMCHIYNGETKFYQNKCNNNTLQHTYNPLKDYTPSKYSEQFRSEYILDIPKELERGVLKSVNIARLNVLIIPEEVLKSRYSDEIYNNFKNIQKSILKEEDDVLFEAFEMK